MNPYLEIEQDEFDTWLRNAWKECGETEACYERVWQQITNRIAKAERELTPPDYAIRTRGFLEIVICCLINPIRKISSARKMK
jgi:hypothetical protein